MFCVAHCSVFVTFLFVTVTVSTHQYLLSNFLLTSCLSYLSPNQFHQLNYHSGRYAMSLSHSPCLWAAVWDSQKTNGEIRGHLGNPTEDSVKVFFFFFSNEILTVMLNQNKKLFTLQKALLHTKKFFYAKCLHDTHTWCLPDSQSKNYRYYRHIFWYYSTKLKSSHTNLLHFMSFTQSIQTENIE